MSGPFEEAAKRLMTAKEEAEKLARLLGEAQEQLLQVRGMTDAIYAGTNAGEDVQRLAGNLTQGILALTTGAMQLAQALQEGANRAAQGRS